MEKTYFNGRAFEDEGITVERVKDPIPEMREELEPKPNGHGSYLNSLTMSPRDITLECRYFGNRWADFDQMMDDISAWLITDDDVPMSLRNNPHQHYMAHYVSYEEGDREGGTGIGGFTLTFRASDPLRHGEERASVVKAGEPKSFEVAGTDRADLVIEVRNMAFSNGSFALTLAGNGRTYRLETTNKGADGSTMRMESLTFDCANHVCRYAYTQDGRKVTKEWGVTLESDWPDFQPGPWTVSTSSGTATLSWTQRYR